jgi:hypothetical protein
VTLIDPFLADLDGIICAAVRRGGALVAPEAEPIAA